MSTFETNMDSTKAYTEQQPCSCISSSKKIKQEIVEFAKRAEGLAIQLLPSTQTTSTYEGPVIIHNHYCHSWDDPWYWHRPTTVIVTDGDKCCWTSPKSEERKKREKDANAIALAIVAVAVAAGTLYSMSCNWTAWGEANQEINNTKDFQDKLNNFSEQFPEKEQKAISQAHDIADLKERICRRIKNSEKISFIFKGGIVTGLLSYAGGVFAVGGHNSTSMGLLVGVPAAVTCTALLIFKCGLNSAGSRNIRDAKVLKDAAQQLQTI